MVSPLAVIYYEEYSDEERLAETLQNYSNKIQCIVSNSNLNTTAVPIGNSQLPDIDDYADNIDTMTFLCNFSEN
jgi:hypothetical protein